MSEKNPLPVAKGRTPALLLLVVASLVALPLLLPSATLATEILIFALAALACNLLLGYTACCRSARASSLAWAPMARRC